MSLIQEPVDCQTYPMKRATHFCVGWYGDGGLNGLANDGRHGELEGVHRGEAGGEAQGDMVDGDRIYGPTTCHTTRNVLWAPSIRVLSLRWALRGFSSAWTIAPFSSIGPPFRYTPPSPRRRPSSTHRQHNWHTLYSIFCRLSTLST